ncbi:MAG TPA: hypothetical protein VNT75_29025 [Symbiobacteriaceae bacterium]|nr:hypothetical protein [Symbiobacteriaceae bacterium]
MEAWVDSIQYRQVMNACRANDRNTLNHIIEERLAAVTGPERAFWLRVRAAQRARDALMPHLVEMAWVDLRDALQAAPDDQEERMQTLLAAFGLSLTGERPDKLVEFLKAMRPGFRRLADTPFFWQGLGFMNMKRGRWRKAARAFGRAIATFDLLSPYEQELYACRPAHFHAWRAICLVGCGETERAAADMDTANGLAQTHPPQNINHSALGVAQAELALERGLIQEARTALQHGVMQDALLKRPKAEPAHLAERELLAARIARAEGNHVGFGHFCEKALAICTQYRLPLTEQRVRAVMAGAAR